MKIKISKSQWEEMGKKAGWIKVADDFGGEYENRSRIDPNFDVKKHIKNDLDAAVLLYQIMIIEPERLPAFVGMKENELYGRIRNNLQPILSKAIATAPPDIKEELLHLNLQVNSYSDALRTIKILLHLFGGDNYALLGLLPIFGFKSMEAVQRIHDYAPFVMRSTEELEKSFEEKKVDKQRAIDSILDRYNAGKIDRSKMEMMLKEFAGYKIKMIKTANEIEYKWVRV